MGRVHLWLLPAWALWSGSALSASLQLFAGPQGAGLRRTEGGLEMGILSLPF